MSVLNLIPECLFQAHITFISALGGNKKVNIFLHSDTELRAACGPLKQKQSFKLKKTCFVKYEMMFDLPCGSLT